MRRVTYEDHAASMPSVDFDSFNRPKMKLLIVFYRAEIGRDRCRKFGEAPTKPFEAPLKRVLGAFYVEGAEAVGVTLAPIGTRPKKRPSPISTYCPQSLVGASPRRIAIPTARHSWVNRRRPLTCGQSNEYRQPRSQDRSPRWRRH